jgi:hypothetical protein
MGNVTFAKGEPMTMPGQEPVVKMVTVDARDIESVGYVVSKRKLYVKFRNSAALCFEGVPGFRYQGLLAAPRKDAYYSTYIKDRFLAKEFPPGMA